MITIVFLILFSILTIVDISLYRQIVKKMGLIEEILIIDNKITSILADDLIERKGIEDESNDNSADESNEDVK